MSTINPEQHRQEGAEPYYRKFELQELGVETDTLLQQIGSVYDTLQWDQYDTALARIALPTRKRALANTLLKYADGVWSIERIPAEPYVQPNHGGYLRSSPRIYPEISPEITDYPELQKMQIAIAEMIRNWRGATRMRFVITFLRAVHDDQRGGNCAFEGGPHQDGADAIVSACVIQRADLDPESGRSSVHGLDGTELFGTVLQPGEGILQDDKNLQHHITNIQRRIGALSGFRDILGIDIHILSDGL